MSTIEIALKGAEVIEQIAPKLPGLSELIPRDSGLIQKTLKAATDILHAHKLLPLSSVLEDGLAKELVDFVADKSGRSSNSLFALNGIKLQSTTNFLVPSSELKRFVGKDALNMSSELSRSQFPWTLRGAEFKYPVEVGQEQRFVTVHLPPTFSPEKPTPVFYLADGVQRSNPEGEMLHGYHWAETADKNNFVAVALTHSLDSVVQISNPRLARLMPKNTAWRTPNGFLNASEKVDDVAYFTRVNSGVSQAMTVAKDATNFVGFSDGGVYGHALAARFPFNGLATVGSTTIKDVTPTPLPGIKGVFTTMADDPVLPISGGPGSAFGKLLVKFGHEHILGSQPLQQAPSFAEVNRLVPELPVITESGTERLWRSADGKLGALEISMKEGGHNWPGTIYDGDSASGSIQVSPQIARNFNQRIAEMFKVTEEERLPGI